MADLFRQSVYSRMAAYQDVNEPSGCRNIGVPAHWLAYFFVSDCDATSAKAKELGAKLFMPPTDFEDVGRISVIGDPQGATFAIFKAAARRAGAS